MKIINNYNGSSVNINQIDIISNKAFLFLVYENGNASHYFNFIVENESSKRGTVTDSFLK